MNRLIGILVALGSLLAPLGAAAQSRGDKAVCASVHDLAEGWDSAETSRFRKPVNPDRVIAACTRVLAAAQLPVEERTQALRRRGVAWSGKFKFLSKRGLADFDEAIRLNPRDAGSYRARAWAREMLDESKELVAADFEEAIRLEPRDPRNFLARSFFRESTGDKEGAISDVEEAVRVAPELARARVTRAGYLQSTDVDRALAELDEAIRLDPTLAIAYQVRAEIWMFNKGDVDRALADFSELIRLAPLDEEAYIHRALVQFRRGNDAAAIEDYSTAIRLNPRKAITRFYRGGAHLSIGNAALAQADFNSATRPAWNDSWALDSMASRFATSNDPAMRDGKRAVRLARRACEITSWKKADYLDTLAAAYAEAGRLADAVRWQEKALGFIEFEKSSGEDARKRLALYRAGQPYRR